MLQLSVLEEYQHTVACGWGRPDGVALGLLGVLKDRILIAMTITTQTNKET